MSAKHDQGRISQEQRRATQARPADDQRVAEGADSAPEIASEMLPAGHSLPPAIPYGRPPLQGERVLREAAVLRLQQTHGNAYVARAIARERSGTPAVQRSVVQRATSFADAKRTIQQQTERWGTDEEAIYSAIRDCSDRPRLKADGQVQQWLRDELSGHELWKAQLLLEFGRESAFPQAIRQIWTATEGWGTDEEAIRRTLRQLSPAEARRVATIPGVRDILGDELSGSDLRETEELLTGGPQAQITRHKANVVQVRTEIANMRNASEPEVNNTAEWVSPARGGRGRNKLYIVTPTHDSAARARRHGRPTDVAFFGDQNLYPDDSATYDVDIESERNIYYSPPAAAGWHGGDTIWLLDPTHYGSSAVREFLVHEVQHDADRHDREAGYAGTRGSPEDSWNRYKTEFRAYWIAGFQSESTRSGTATKTGFDNAKQEAIFDHLMGSTLYNVWLQPNYNNNTEVSGQRFKDLVHNYTMPEGVNLINSPRIDDFFRALERCQPSNTDLNSTPLREVVAAANALNEVDRDYINLGPTARLRAMMREHLGLAPFTRIATIVGGGTLPAWLGTGAPVEAPPEIPNTGTALA